MRFPIKDHGQTMAALLVPSAHLGHLKWKENKLDLGETVLAVLGSMAADEFAVSLGCYDCSLEMELYHASTDALSEYSRQQSSTGSIPE